MSWVRLDVDTPIDERLFGSGFALYWPAVLTRAKKGGGHISRLASSPKQLAALWGSTVEEWTSALRYFVEVGLLVVRPDGDGYDVADWSKEQVDPTNSDRQKRHRARESAPTSHDKTVTRALLGDEQTVTRPLLPPDETVTTYIHTDIQDTTVHSSSSVPPPPSEADEADEDLRTVVSAWLSTQLTPRGHVRVQATGHELEALRRTLATHGRERTLASIRRAADTAETASPKLALFLAIAERGVLEGPRPEAASRRQVKPEAKMKRAELAADDDYWAEGREASRRLGGRRVTKVPGVGYVATEELTAEHIAAVEAAGFAVL